ncbi:MAG: hypothetical protein AB8B95_12550 [Pseudohongiellaceae bacterium]
MKPQSPNSDSLNPTNSSSPYVPPGMPPLDLAGKSTSFFEFWPTWVVYVPVVLQWVLLSIRYRSLSLPLIANPAVPLSGMVGVAKSAVFDGAGDYARQWILPWTLYEVTEEALDIQTGNVNAQFELEGFELPIVGKPNIGCRGAGVKLLKTSDELQAYLSEFPAGGIIQFQKLSEWEAEAGVFYVKHPQQASGRITSLTLKYTPYVVGDGQKTLGDLVSEDPRAGELLHLYEQRHQLDWDRVLSAHEPYRLVFSASHCRGAVFRNAEQLISTELSQSLDRIFADIPNFHYGRLDVKFKDPQSLQEGRDFEIIEINGASSESIDIWDRNAKLSTAVKTLLQQYNTLFKLGNENRKLGHKPPGILRLLAAWRFETNLVKQYPKND